MNSSFSRENIWLFAKNQRLAPHNRKPRFWSSQIASQNGQNQKILIVPVILQFQILSSDAKCQKISNIIDLRSIQSYKINGYDQYNQLHILIDNLRHTCSHEMSGVDLRSNARMDPMSCSNFPSIPPLNTGSWNMFWVFGMRLEEGQRLL